MILVKSPKYADEFRSLSLYPPPQPGHQTVMTLCGVQYSATLLQTIISTTAVWFIPTVYFNLIWCTR